MAFQIRGKLSMDGSGFNAGIAKAKAKAKSLKTAIGSAFSKLGPMMGAMAGAMAVAMIGTQIKKTIEWGTRIRDLGMQFGVSTGFVQKMDYAFKQTGLDVEVAFKSFRKMQLAISQARAGIEGMTKTTADMKLGAFKILGITLGDIKSLGAEDLFMKIARQVKGMNFASADLHQAMNDIFGKKGSELLVTFGNDLDGLAAKMERLGLVEDENIQRLGRIGDKMEEFKTQNRGMWADMVGGFHEAWMGFVDFVSATVTVISERMAALWSGLSNMALAAQSLIQGIMGRDLNALRQGVQDIKAATKDMEAAFSGVRGSGFMGAAGDISKIMLGKADERGERMKQRELDKKGALEAQSVADAIKERMEAEDSISKLKEDALKRETESMSIAQKLLHFNMQLLAAREKLAKLGDLHSKEQIAAATKGLDPVAAADKASEMTEENLKRLEAEKEVAGLTASQAKAQSAQAKAAPKKDLAGWAGDAKFAALARIGGALGGRNPVLDIAKKQYYTIQELRDIARRQAASLSTMSGTP